MNGKVLRRTLFMGHSRKRSRSKKVFRFLCTSLTRLGVALNKSCSGPIELLLACHLDSAPVRRTYSMQQNKAVQTAIVRSISAARHRQRSQQIGDSTDIRDSSPLTWNSTPVVHSSTSLFLLTPYVYPIISQESSVSLASYDVVR